MSRQSWQRLQMKSFNIVVATAAGTEQSCQCIYFIQVLRLVDNVFRQRWTYETKIVLCVPGPRCFSPFWNTVYTVLLLLLNQLQYFKLTTVTPDVCFYDYDNDFFYIFRFFLYLDSVIQHWLMLMVSVGRNYLHNVAQISVTSFVGADLCSLKPINQQQQLRKSNFVVDIVKEALLLSCAVPVFDQNTARQEQQSSNSHR